MKSCKSQTWSLLLQDVVIILLGISLAVLMAKTGFLEKFLVSTQKARIFGSFVAGLFFTSIFTVAPSVVALGEIAQANSIWLVAFFGGMGAVIGDLVIFSFVRDRFSEHLMQLVGKKDTRAVSRAFFKLKMFRWFTFLIAGIIIASPLPDELGISLLGFSKTRMSLFIPFSFVCNSIGILIIGLAVKSFF